jgi:chromosome segregation ATPase
LLGSEETVISLQVKYERLKAELQSQIQQLTEEAETAAAEKQAVDASMQQLSSQLAEHQEKLAQVNVGWESLQADKKQVEFELEQAGGQA